MLRGVFPVLPTPFHEDGRVDEESFERVIEHCIAAGSDGLVHPAGASEYATLTKGERLALAERLLKTVNGRVPVVVGVSAEDPEESAELARHAACHGARAVIILVPRSLPADGAVEGMGRYLEPVRRAGDLPIMLQHAPALGGAGLTVEQVVQIVERHPSVKYVKEEASPSGQRVSHLMAALGDQVEGVFGGDGGRSVLNELARGAAGTMPAAELTECFVDLVKRYSQGESQQAAQRFVTMLPLLNMQRIFRWAVTKRILLWRNVIRCDYVRIQGAPRLDETDAGELRMWYRLATAGGQ